MEEEEASPFPYTVPENVPVSYELREDQAGLADNVKLAKATGKLAEYCNYATQLTSDSFFGKNCSYDIEKMKAIIKKTTIAIHEKIVRVGDNAFQIPEVILKVLKYLDIPYPPEV